MPEDADLLASALADRYRIDVGPDGQPVVLGRGGMAVVYRAWDVRHERRVAVKVLHTELSALIGIDRFLTEIRVTAQLQHPHIVPLLDSGSLGGDGSGRPFYVMPCISGESLAARLERTKPLPVHEAIRIVEQVAAALDYAHSQGVIHRDIKPSNILLSGAFALVVDFGLARALDRASQVDSGTVPGLAVGTPKYMSPEQGLGLREVGPRSDIYSLACVLYELLTGAPPYDDASPYAVLIKHRSAPIPSLKAASPTVSRSAAIAFERAMAKEPEQRFETAGTFAAELSATRKPSPYRLASRTLLITGVVVAAILGAKAIWDNRFAVVPARPLLDTLRFLVVPSPLDSTASPSFSPSSFLQTGLERWNGISIVQRFQVQEAVARTGHSVQTASQARTLAQSLGAGRFIRVQAIPTGVRTRIDAILYDTRSGAPVREASVDLEPEQSADSVYSALADRLVLGPGNGSAGTHGESRSLPARLAFLQGQAALADWDLPSAEAAFSRAYQLDSGYARADLWFAQVQFWSRTLPISWRAPAERASRSQSSLASGDLGRARALLLYSRGNLFESCRAWQELIEREPTDFSVWYSHALCLESDSIVIPDSRSPSGWRFRSSFASKVKSYQRAFELFPKVHRSLRRDSYDELQNMLWTSRTKVEPGWPAPPDTGWFLSYLIYQGDSLVRVPYPALQVMTQAPPLSSQAQAEAEVRQRYLFRDIASAWARAYPASGDALEALAVALDLLGDPSAVDTLRRARELATTSDERSRVAVAEIWLRLKLSLPDDLLGIARIRALADTVLEHATTRNAAEQLVLVEVAALTGHARLACDLVSRATASLPSDLPRHLDIAVRKMRLLAALGGPRDSLIATDRLIAQEAEHALTGALLGPFSLDWAGATTLAFPTYHLKGLERLKGRGYLLLEAQAEAAKGNFEAARRLIRGLKGQRAGIPASDIAIDAVLPEARLILAYGDTAEAVAWLDQSLGALSRVRTGALAFPGRSSSLLHALALRAELADALGDGDGARRWASPVVRLWSDADPFLQPMIDRLHRLVR